MVWQLYVSLLFIPHMPDLVYLVTTGRKGGQNYAIPFQTAMFSAKSWRLLLLKEEGNSGYNVTISSLYPLSKRYLVTVSFGVTCYVVYHMNAHLNFSPKSLVKYTLSTNILEWFPSSECKE